MLTKNTCRFLCPRHSCMGLERDSIKAMDDLLPTSDELHVNPLLFALESCGVAMTSDDLLDP
ncbi:hypothetical protein B0O80DRAFT_449612 [Mortierella sp. GBAus27b]|nr:hypothetical protein B0O80DRAFT_449612 [Mortierella sp. GBAus27b]